MAIGCICVDLHPFHLFPINIIFLFLLLLAPWCSFFFWNRLTWLPFYFGIRSYCYHNSQDVIQNLLSMPFWLDSQQKLNGGYTNQNAPNYWIPNRYWIPFNFPRFCGFISKVAPTIYIQAFSYGVAVFVSSDGSPP